MPRNSHCLRSFNLWLISGVVYAATPSLLAKFQTEKHLDVPPEVALGSGWIIHDANEFADVLKEIELETDSARVLALREAQKRMGMLGLYLNDPWPCTQQLS